MKDRRRGSCYFSFPLERGPTSLSDRPKLPTWAWALFLLIFGLTIAYGGLIFGVPFSIWKIGSFEQRGLFGDSFGALNTLFSGLAFGGVIVTLYLQMQELREQRCEFKKQSEALAAQVEVARKAGQAQLAGALLDHYATSEMHASLSFLTGWRHKHLEGDLSKSLKSYLDEQLRRGQRPWANVEVDEARRVVSQHFHKIYVLRVTDLLEEETVRKLVSPYMLEPYLRIVKTLQEMRAKADGEDYDEEPFRYFENLGVTLAESVSEGVSQ